MARQGRARRGGGCDHYGRLAIRDGRLVGAEASPGSGRWRWTPEPAGSGYVIAAKELEHAGSRRIHRYRYRHPTPRVAREVRVTVDAPAAHAEWQGVLKPTADVLMHGEQIAATAVGDALSPTTRDVIGAVVAGRLGMWRGVDFAEGGAFDRVFDGAKIEVLESGRVTLKDAPYRFVEIADGGVQALGLQDGRTRRLHWRKVGGVFVVDRIAQGHEEFRVRFRKTAGVLAPVRIEIRNRFGPDWGIEMLELADR